MPYAALMETEKKIHEAVNAAVEEIRDLLKEHDGLQELLRQHLPERSTPETEELQFGVIGEQSSGKSTFLNGICGYPILPTASTITSTCPVEIRKSETEYLQVVWEQGYVELDPLAWEEDFAFRLLEYALACFHNDVIACDNLNYLTERDMRQRSGAKETLTIGDFALFDPKNPRQVLMLLMILLGSYVGSAASGDESPQREAIKAMRRELLEELGIDADAEYVIRLFWNSDLLTPQGVIVDLPGLGDLAGRSRITDGYMSRVDSVVVLFNPDAKDRYLVEFVRNFQESEKLKPVTNKRSRVVAVMNKADTCMTGIGASVQSIREYCDLPREQVIYPASALSGEYAYAKTGGVDIRATLRYKRMLREMTEKKLARSTQEQLQEDAMDYLEAAYETKFRFGEGEGEAISLPELQEKIICRYPAELRCAMELEEVQKTVSGFEQLKNDIRLQRSMLVFLQKCGRSITRELSDALAEANRQALKEFTEKLLTVSDALRQELECREQLEEAKELYRSDLERLEADIDNMVGRTVAGMHRRFGRIRLSDSRNRSRFDDLTAWLSGEAVPGWEKLEISRYLHSGNDKLKAVLEDQRKKYEDGKQSLAECYRSFPDIFSACWDKAYDKVKEKLLSKNENIAAEDLAAYDEQTKLLKEAARAFIHGLTLRRIEALEKDNFVETEFETTANHLRSYWNALAEYYYKRCPEMLKKCKNETFFTGNQYLTTKEVKALFKNRTFAAEGKQVFTNALDVLLTKRSSDGQTAEQDLFLMGFLQKVFSQMLDKLRTRNSHLERVTNAVNGLNKRLCAGNEQELQAFSNYLKKEIKALIGSGKGVYVQDRQRLDATQTRIRAVLGKLKAQIGADLQELSRTEVLHDDALSLLEKLGKVC